MTAGTWPARACREPILDLEGIPTFAEDALHG
jgi:hypothetical protein